MPSANHVSSSVASSGKLTQDVATAGEDFLTVIADVGPGATAATDVSVGVVPYLTDYEPTDHGNGPTLADTGLDLVQTTVDPGVAAYLAGGHARVMVRVRVTGVERVQLQVTNHNTSALPARVDFYFD